MTIFTKNILKIFTFCGLGFASVACNNDEPSDSPYWGNGEKETKESTILIYAVATNSLSSNLVSDKQEMLQAASEIDLNKNNVILFQTVYGRDEITNETIGKVSLLQLKGAKDDQSATFELVKDYPSGTHPLDPSCVSEVISKVIENYPAEQYGLIFWSHSSGSQPYINPATSTKSADEAGGSVSLPSVYWFGQDLTSTEKDFTYLNVDDLEKALPYGKFNFIWFDSCYMGNVESVYQLRKKCNYYVGYATEVWEYGMPYELVLPQLVGKDPDLASAAKTFFDYYNESPYTGLRNATVLVCDMKKIENLADYCRKLYTPGLTPTDTYNYIKYTRGSSGPFYDLGDYTKALAKLSGYEIPTEEWNSVLDECLLYMAATPTDFNRNPIYPERFSGFSTHIYTFAKEGENDSEAEAYYKSLDWYQTTFAN